MGAGLTLWVGVLILISWCDFCPFVCWTRSFREMDVWDFGWVAGLAGV